MHGSLAQNGILIMLLLFPSWIEDSVCNKHEIPLQPFEKVLKLTSLIFSP